MQLSVNHHIPIPCTPPRSSKTKKVKEKEKENEKRKKKKARPRTSQSSAVSRRKGNQKGRNLQVASSTIENACQKLSSTCGVAGWVSHSLHLLQTPLFARPLPSHRNLRQSQILGRINLSVSRSSHNRTRVGVRAAWC